MTHHIAEKHRRCLVWWAVLIAVFAALMPTLAHARALQQVGVSHGLVYCTSTGVQEVASQKVPGAPGDQESAPSFDHCPFCLLHTDRALLPLHSQVHCFAVLRNDLVPTARQAFFLRAHTAPMPPPRGPPVFH